MGAKGYNHRQDILSNFIKIEDTLNSNHYPKPAEMIENYKKTIIEKQNLAKKLGYDDLVKKAEGLISRIQQLQGQAQNQSGIIAKQSINARNTITGKYSENSTKEKISPLSIKEVQTASKKSLDAAKLNSNKSIQVAAKYFKLPNSEYNQAFIAKLKEFQKKYKLREDGILGPNSMAILVLSVGVKEVIELSTDKELINFYKAIESNTVTESMLMSIDKRLTLYGGNILAQVESNSSKKVVDILNSGGENPMVLLSVLSYFELKADKKSDLYKSHKKRGDAIETEFLKNHPHSSLINKNKASSKATSIEEKLGEATEAIKKNPLIMATAMIGFVMFIFGKRDKFAIAGFTGLLAVMGGPALIKTLKDVGSAFGFNMDSLMPDPKKVADAKASTTQFMNNASQKTESWFKKAAAALGVGVDKVKENFASKNTAIEATMLANNPKLNNKKINTLKSISIDSEFKKVKIGDILKTKISELSKETQEKFKKAGIKETDKEFSEYLKVLSSKIIEANNSDKKIKTVGDYFTSTIDKDRLSIAAGVGTMGIGLFFKNMPAFLVGATAVGAGITGAWDKFFDTDGKKYISKATSIFETSNILIQDYITTKKLPSEITESINKFLPDGFDGIKKLADNHPGEKAKLLEIASKVEELFYTAAVESKTGDNSFIPDFIGEAADYIESSVTELTDRFDERKKAVGSAIKFLEELKSKIEGTAIPNKTLLIAKIKAEIAKSKLKIKLVEAQKLSSREENKTKLQTELNKLIQEKEDLEKKVYTGKSREVDEAQRDIKVIELDSQIKDVKQKLSLAGVAVSNLKKEKIEKPENIKKLEDSIKVIEDINSSTDLLTLISNKGKLSSTNLPKVTAALKEIFTVKESYNGTNTQILALKEKGIKATEDLLILTGNIAAAIIAKISAHDIKNYPSEHIKNFKNIYSAPGLISVEPFNEELLKKKTEVFKTAIKKANIEEIQILKRFIDVEGYENAVKGRVEILAKIDLVKDNKTLNKAIDNLKVSDYITQGIIDKIKSFSTVYELYKYINNTEYLNKLSQIVENKYGKLNVVSKKNKKVTQTAPKKSNNIDSPQVIGQKARISPNDIFKS